MSGCTEQKPCRMRLCPFCDPDGYMNMPLGGPKVEHNDYLRTLQIDEEPSDTEYAQWRVTVGLDEDPEDEPEPDILAGIRDGAWLDAQNFPPVRYAVPEVIPEGLTLLVGAPKIGKSWLILGMLLGVASGGAALGSIRLDQPRRVLYLALEDGDRRMQDRCRQLLGPDPIPAAYTYLTRAEPNTILPVIDAYLDRYDDTALVVIDTLGKVMPQALPQETMYQRDYRVGGKLKAIADRRPGLALVVVHHDRKAGADDFVERVSGSHGLAGAADTVIVLSRDRQSTDGIVQITGRDIPEGEYALAMAGMGTWVLDGDDLAEASRRAQERKSIEGLGERSAEVIRLVVDRYEDNPEGITPSYVAAELGMDSKTAQVYLSRAVEASRLSKLARGRYAPWNPVGSVGLLVSEHDQTNNQHNQHPDTPPTGVWERVCSSPDCTNPLYSAQGLETGLCWHCRKAEEET